MSATTRYLLDNAETVASERMPALARLFDAATHRALEAVGISPGWQCLEVGGGGGSVARWMAQRVGTSGSVLCTDIDPRHIAPSGLANLHVVRHDAARDEFPQGQFDLAHARLVLLHIPERALVLERMIAALKPGGWLVIEDFDTTSVLPDLSANPAEAWMPTADAMRTFMMRGGVDARFGRSLYGRFKRLGLTEVRSEGRTMMLDGVNGGAELLRINYRQVGDKLVAAGMLKSEQLRADQARLDDPDFVTPSPIMWMAAGRKPLAPQGG